MIEVAIYARVSSERQARDATIESQLEALKQRVQDDGHPLLPSDIYADEGYSGSTLLRPALEKLRDRAAEGRLALLYVLSPDRLARKFAHQALLLEELVKAGVDVTFVNHPVGDSPEDQLLLQMQGMIAEYERAKIIERHRRGKLHRARRGSVNVLGGAPYGYLYIRKTEANDARYEILESEAAVVRKMFHWYAIDQLSLGEIARRLKHEGIRTRNGLVRWDRGTVWGILRNPAYMGKACFGKTESTERKRTTKASPPIPKHAKSGNRQKPREEWIEIDVPAIVEPDVFDAAQQQLDRNKQLAKRNTKGEYLVRGLVVCRKCSHALYGKPVKSRPTKQGKVRHYGYYRCIGTDSYRFEGGRICDNTQFRIDELDGAVWQAVTELLTDPQRILSEFHRRQTADGRELSSAKSQRDGLLRAKQKAENGLQRLMDAYEAGVLSLEELKPRIDAARSKLKSLKEQVHSADEAVAQNLELRGIVTQLSQFQEKLNKGLHELDFDERCQIVRLLVSRVVAYQGEVSVVYRVPTASGFG